MAYFETCPQTHQEMLWISLGIDIQFTLNSNVINWNVKVGKINIFGTAFENYEFIYFKFSMRDHSHTTISTFTLWYTIGTLVSLMNKEVSSANDNIWAFDDFDTSLTYIKYSKGLRMNPLLYTTVYELNVRLNSLIPQ